MSFGVTFTRKFGQEPKKEALFGRRAGAKLIHLEGGNYNPPGRWKLVEIYDIIWNMTPEDPLLYGQLVARADEIKARVLLAGNQVQNSLHGVEDLIDPDGPIPTRIELSEASHRLRRNSENFGSITADAYWVKALDEAGVPLDLILKAWDRRDELSRETRELFREEGLL